MSAQNDKAIQAALTALGISVSGDPNAPVEPTPPERTEEDIERGLADERELRGVPDDSESTGPTPPNAPTLDALIAAVKADPIGHLDPDVISGALTLSPRDLETLTAILKANNRSLKAFNAAMAQARSAVRNGARDKGRAAKRAPQEANEKTDAMVVVNKRQECEVDDEAASLLKTWPDLYQRNGRLVRVIRPRNADPAILEYDADSFRGPLTRYVKFHEHYVKEAESGAYVDVYVPTTAPLWCVKDLLSRPEWEGVKELADVIAAPTIRRDLTVLNKPGYDEASELLFLPRREFPDVPEHPTQEQIDAAHATLRDPFHDVLFSPFGPCEKPKDNQELNRAGAIAAVMTLVCRFGIDSSVPLFEIGAADSGTGKGLTYRIITYSALGQRGLIMSATSDVDEFSKTALGYLQNGHRAVCIDNIPEGIPFGNEVLDSILTAHPTWTKRGLGSNRLITVSTNALWLTTGNKITYKNSDLGRRTVKIELHSPDANTATIEKAFKHPDIDAFCKEAHPRIVSAVLTLVRGWVTQGKKMPEKQVYWGSYVQWGALIPPILCWLGYPDLGLRIVAEARASESSRGLRKLIQGWESLCGFEGPKKAVEVMRAPAGYDPAMVQTLMAGVEELDTRKGEPRKASELSEKSLGRLLTRCVNKIAEFVEDGKTVKKMLVKIEINDVAKYRVDLVPASGVQLTPDASVEPAEPA